MQHEAEMIKLKYSGRKLSQWNFYTILFTRTDRKLRPRLRGEKPTTNRLNHDTAFKIFVQVSHTSVENRLL
jgi:hypothetical protein